MKFLNNNTSVVALKTQFVFLHKSPESGGEDIPTRAGIDKKLHGDLAKLQREFFLKHAEKAEAGPKVAKVVEKVEAPSTDQIEEITGKLKSGEILTQTEVAQIRAERRADIANSINPEDVSGIIAATQTRADKMGFKNFDPSQHS